MYQGKDRLAMERAFVTIYQLLPFCFNINVLGLVLLKLI